MEQILQIISSSKVYTPEIFAICSFNIHDYNGFLIFHKCKGCIGRLRVRGSDPPPLWSFKYNANIESCQGSLSFLKNPGYSLGFSLVRTKDFEDLFYVREMLEKLC